MVAGFCILLPKSLALYARTETGFAAASIHWRCRGWLCMNAKTTEYHCIAFPSICYVVAYRSGYADFLQLADFRSRFPSPALGSLTLTRLDSTHWHWRVCSEGHRLSEMSVADNICEIFWFEVLWYFLPYTVVGVLTPILEVHGGSVVRCHIYYYVHHVHMSVRRFGERRWKRATLDRYTIILIGFQRV